MACFFIALSWKGFQCRVKDNKKDLYHIKCRYILDIYVDIANLGALEGLKIY